MDRLSFEFPMDNWKINEDPLEIDNRRIFYLIAMAFVA